jgi:nucleoside phosphorylase
MSSPEELRPFLRTVSHRRASFQGGKAWNFQERNFTGLAFLTGMGGTAPRVLITRALAAHPPDVVIVAGFGGALTPLPPPTGLLIASECWRLPPPGGLLLPIGFSPPAPPASLASLLQANGLSAFTGASVTTPVVTPKASLPDQVFHLPRPVLDLETAEIAAIAQIYNLPCLTVRAITDGAGEEIQQFLADIINQYQGVPLSRLLPALLADPRRVQYCFHLWCRSHLAAQNLARALNLIIDHLSRQQPFQTQH